MPLKCGDVCIVLPRNGYIYDKYTGMEVTLLDFITDTSSGNFGYWRTDCIDEYSRICFLPSELKKKPFKGEENIMKLFTSLYNSGKIESDKLIEEEIV